MSLLWVQVRGIGDGIKVCFVGAGKEFDERGIVTGRDASNALDLDRLFLGLFFIGNVSRQFARRKIQSASAGGSMRFRIHKIADLGVRTHQDVQVSF